MKILSTERPWGNFRQFTENEKSTVKIITVNPGEEFSLQYHNHREEFWRVISGDPEIVIGDSVVRATGGDEFTVQVKELHRIRAEKLPAVILEIATGDFDENDIIRTEDKYGRA